MTESGLMHPKDFGRVAVLMGGDSAEREISLMSGQATLESLSRSGVVADKVDMQGSDAIQKIVDGGYDRVLIMLHGRKGEDGKVQAALELMDIPYTGSGVIASALAMDKVLCKRVWQGFGISTPEFSVLDETTDWQAVIDELGTVFVKPAKEGSSIGISRAATADELESAYRQASRYDSQVIAERFIQGAEYTVGILGEKILPSVGMQAEGDFYDYQAKYFSDETLYSCPSDLDEQAEAELGAMARQAYDVVGCSGWGRVDAMRDDSGRFWLLEVNTVPGMTDHSLVPKAAEEAGISFDDLVLQILSSSYKDRRGE